MRAAGETHFRAGAGANPESRCALAVLYEDSLARDRALDLCHSLVRRFWPEIDFDFTWWRFRFLEDDDLARAAGLAVSDADVVIVAMESSGELPETIARWVHEWLPRRVIEEGILVALSAATIDNPLADRTVRCLREAAARAGLEYLGQGELPETGSAADRWGDLERRATRGSRVLDEILRHLGPPPAPPSHWGINE